MEEREEVISSDTLFLFHFIAIIFRFIQSFSLFVNSVEQYSSDFINGVKSFILVYLFCFKYFIIIFMYSIHVCLHTSE